MKAFHIQCSEELQRQFCEQSGKRPDQIREIEDIAREVQASNERAIGMAVFTIAAMGEASRNQLKGTLTFQTSRYIESVVDAITDADIKLAENGWQHLDVLNGPFDSVEALSDFAAFSVDS
jgi:hypothetical protein